MLTNDPDLEGFRRSLLDLAGGAVVVEGSLSESEGVVRGELALSDSRRAEFSISPDGEYLVSLTEPKPPEGEGRFPLMETTVSFKEDQGWLTRGSAGIAFHPDTSVPAQGKRVVGWSLRVDDDGMVAVPTVAEPGNAPGSWRIRPEKERILEQPWDTSRVEFEHWMRLLRPYRAR